MSIPGSGRSPGGEGDLPAAAESPAPRAKKRPGTRIFRWQGILPLILVLTLLLVGWTMLGGRIVRATLAEAGTKALGAQLDIADVNIGVANTMLRMTGIELADPFDRHRNLFEIGRVLVELEPRPLLEKKVVIRRLSIADVRTGTRRARPAEPVTGGGFAPRALAEVQRFAAQFNV